MGIEGMIVHQNIEKKQLTWFGNVERMSDSRRPNMKPTGRDRRGKLKLVWQKSLFR